MAVLTSMQPTVSYRTNSTIDNNVPSRKTTARILQRNVPAFVGRELASTHTNSTIEVFVEKSRVPTIYRRETSPPHRRSDKRRCSIQDD